MKKEKGRRTAADSVQSVTFYPLTEDRLYYVPLTKTEVQSKITYAAPLLGSTYHSTISHHYLQHPAYTLVISHAPSRQQICKCTYTTIQSKLVFKSIHFRFRKVSVNIRFPVSSFQLNSTQRPTTLILHPLSEAGCRCGTFSLFPMDKYQLFTKGEDGYRLDGYQLEAANPD
ncbi:hypothetical protein TNCV_3599711 [Trichonephila clavipes]|nr:hypothetical protein TNCV_3599711 [Trichonephila clavipes]